MYWKNRVYVKGFRSNSHKTTLTRQSRPINHGQVPAVHHPIDYPRFHTVRLSSQTKGSGVNRCRSSSAAGKYIGSCCTLSHSTLPVSTKHGYTHSAVRLLTSELEIPVVR